MSDTSSELSDIEASLQKVYGNGALQDLEELREHYPNQPDEQLADAIRKRPTPTATLFFRDENLATFATDVAPKMAQALGKQTLRVGQVACSTGDETWSIAAMLEKQGIDYTVRATDINPDVLTEAEAGVYPNGALNVLSDSPAIACKAARMFKQNRREGTFEPDKKLREHVEFAQHDILEGPLPGGPYHALLVNNMLYHYPEATRDRIMENIAGSLAVGGVLVFENCDGPGHEVRAGIYASAVGF